MTYSSADVQLTPDELKQHAELLRYIQNGDVKALEKLLQTEYSLDNLRQKIVGYISTHQTLTQLPDTKKTQIITLLIN